MCQHYSSFSTENTPFMRWNECKWCYEMETLLVYGQYETKVRQFKGFFDPCLPLLPWSKVKQNVLGGQELPFEWQFLLSPFVMGTGQLGQLAQVFFNGQFLTTRALPLDHRLSTSQNTQQKYMKTNLYHQPCGVVQTKSTSRVISSNFIIRLC